MKIWLLELDISTARKPVVSSDQQIQARCCSYWL